MALNDENKEIYELMEEKNEIEKILSVLERGDNPAQRESLRAVVRNHRNYLVLSLKNERGIERNFKISGLYGNDSMPVFLKEGDYRLFHAQYLEKHGYLELLKNEREVLTLKALTGSELFEIIPQSALGSVFVISPNGDELFFNFNLAEVFTDCFRESHWDANFGFPELVEAACNDTDENDESIGAIKKRATRKIEQSRKLRKIVEISEWTVLISQPTKNKLLKGEFSRDDFEMDQHGDGRIFIFSDSSALENYKNRTGQEKLYSIKADSQRIFGTDLSAYELIIKNPYSPDALLIGKDEFRKLNELFTALEIEKELVRIAEAQKKTGHYFEVADAFIAVKEFRKFLLPVNGKTNDVLALKYSPESFSAQNVVPVFTARDSFEAFRLEHLEKYGPGENNFIESRFTDGERLLRELVGNQSKKIIFNPSGPFQPVVFESDLALKIYCA